MQFYFCLKKYRQVGLYFLSEILKTDNKIINLYYFDISHSMLCDIGPVYCLEMGEDNSVLPF